MNLIGKLEKWDEYPKNITKYIVHINTQKFFMSVPNEKYMQFMGEEEWKHYVANSMANAFAAQVEKEIVELFDKNQFQKNYQEGFSYIPHPDEPYYNPPQKNIGSNKGQAPPPEDLFSKIPQLYKFSVMCPKTKWNECPHGNSKISLKTAIIHLNDFHKWSREEIADWLETLDVDLTIGDK